MRKIMKSVHISRDCSIQGHTVYPRKSTKPAYAFLGIPYAEPPIGDLRFQAPVSKPLWSGELKAAAYGPVCPQNKELSSKTHYPFPFPDKMDEDCLFLNIWTPSVEVNEKLPVMFWIYGGAFFLGFSNYYDGTVFASEHNVVFVSINYRVGPFGFMSTGDDVVPGNAGLLDQIEALKWIKKNVAHFGGDPDNITIFGESAGSISSSMHLCSPLTQGLFRRVICQSGTVFHPSSVWPKENARKYIFSRAKNMGFNGSTSKELIDFLSKYSGEELVKSLGAGFNPVIDGNYMPREPSTLYSPRRSQDIQLLLGFNSHEGAQFVFEMAGAKNITDLDTAIQLLEFVIKKMFFRGSAKADEILRIVKEEYLLRDTTGDYIQALTDLYGDLLFIAPSIKAADTHSDLCTTFLYQYSYRMSRNRFPEWVSADHGQEIPLVVGEPEIERMPDIWSDTDRQVSRTLRTYWTNFARTGNPNAHGLPNWPLYEASTRNYLRIDKQASVEKDYRPARMDMWNKVIRNINTRSPVHLKSKH